MLKAILFLIPSLVFLVVFAGMFLQGLGDDANGDRMRVFIYGFVACFAVADIAAAIAIARGASMSSRNGRRGMPISPKIAVPLLIVMVGLFVYLFTGLESTPAPEPFPEPSVIPQTVPPPDPGMPPSEPVPPTEPVTGSTSTAPQ